MGKTADTPEEHATDKGGKRRGAKGGGGSGSPIYGLGMIGALVYFITRAETGEEYLLAVGKSLVWPALLVHQAFKRLSD
jgi:hypothetical protein